MPASWGFLVGCVVLALPTAVAPASATASWSYLAGLTGIVAALWWGALTCDRGATRTGWRWIAVAASMWLAGDTVARVLTALGGDPDAASPADLFWLGSYPAMVAGVTAMIRGRGLPAEVRREIGLDVGVVTAAAAVGAWHLMVQPSLADGRLDLTAALAIAYPLGDVAIFAAAFTLLLSPGARGAAAALLIGCLGSTLVVDALISGLLVAAPGFDSARMDAALLVINGCLGAAALHPSRRALAAPAAGGSGSTQMHRWRVLLLGVALVAVNIAVALPTRPTALDRGIMLAAALAVSITILVRFYRVVREREWAEARLVHAAQHDQLTGLANRALLLDRLGAELLRDRDAPAATGSAAPRDLVLVYVDLDGFKAVNDRYGHAAGDEVLRVVGQRLERATRAGDTVSRLGGDEFVVLCRDVPPDAAERLGDALHDVIVAPIDVGVAEPVTVGASVGLYAASALEAAGHGSLDDLEELLRVADSAMYQAKNDGGGVRRAVAR